MASDRMIWDPGDVIVSKDGAEAGGDRQDAAGDGYNPYRSNGKFAPGPHAERVERVRSEATAVAKVSGHADHAARGEREASKERAAISNEHSALAAGHVAPIATAKLAAYETAHAGIQERAAETRTTLDQHQGHAASAMAQLQAHPEHERHDVHDPTDANEQASAHLGLVAGQQTGTSYDAAATGTVGSYREHAASAQVALETVHDHQTRALATLKGMDREHERAAGAMELEAERHAERGVLAPEVSPGHAAARDAAESLAGHEADRRGDIASAMRTKLEDAHSALREAERGTARSVRDLSRITGRTPRLASK